MAASNPNDSTAPPPEAIAPQMQESSSNWSVLPTELAAVRPQRVAFVALLYAGLYAVAWGSAVTYWTFFANTDPGWVSDHSTLGAERFPVDLVAAVVSIAGALAIAWFAQRGKLNDKLCMVSMLLQVDGAFGIAIAEQWNIIYAPEDIVPGMGVSWVAFWVLLYPLLVPTVPKRALVGSLMAATMGPLATALSIYGTDYEPTTAKVFFMHFPNYIAVGVAYVAARWVYALGKTASTARRLGSYDLVDRIGRGGMGEVWRARHALLKRPAALKLIRPERLRSRTYEDATTLRKRFEREAQATAVLQSPHTVTLYDYGVSDDGTFYYVMELLQGFDLESLVERFGPQSPERVAHILMQAASSLADAHQNGLVHRDIKPANIYASKAGLDLDVVKVLDFGLVKSISADGSQQDTRLTGEGIASGTPAYMAPEVGLGEADVDGQVDIYALGCVAYWLLTGQLVFRGETPMKTVIRHIHDEPIPPSRISELDIPESLEQVIMAMLAKNPKDRPTARELRGLLCGTGLANQWSPMRRFDWWQRNAPDVLAKPCER